MAGYGHDYAAIHEIQEVEIAEWVWTAMGFELPRKPARSHETMCLAHLQIVVPEMEVASLTQTCAVYLYEGCRRLTVRMTLHLLKIVG